LVGWINACKREAENAEKIRRLKQKLTGIDKIITIDSFAFGDKSLSSSVFLTFCVVNQVEVLEHTAKGDRVHKILVAFKHALMLCTVEWRFERLIRLDVDSEIRTSFTHCDLLLIFYSRDTRNNASNNSRKG